MSQQYAPELKARLALAVLTGGSSRDLAVQHGVPEQMIIDWTIAVSQNSGRLLGDQDPPRSAASGSESELLHLCFIRNEKTAGTALGSHLEDQFDADEICPALHHDALEDLALRRNLKEFRLFHGHFFLGWFFLHTQLNFGNTKFITFIRHPLQRQISLYKHWMREPLRVMYVNRLLDLYNSQYLRLSPLPMRRGYATTREHLEAAKTVLDKFFFVGLHERMPESIAALSRRLGHPVPAHVRELNIDPYSPPELPQALKDEIMERNWADMELHKFASSLFERKFASFGKAGASEHLGSFDVAERVSLRMDKAICGDGWYFREGLTPEVPQPWRWSGPGTQSWIAFHLRPDRDYRLSVRIVNFLAPDVLASVRVYVNDTLIALSEVRDLQWGLILHGTVPQSAFTLTTPNARIFFSVGRTIRFCDADPKSSDQRLCGIAISEVNLEPLSG